MFQSTNLAHFVLIDDGVTKFAFSFLLIEIFKLNHRHETFKTFVFDISSKFYHFS